jgi:hypothetical protein
MFKLFKKNKAIAVFMISSVVLYMHELYRLSLGCPRVLGDCYIDGSYDYYLAYAISIHLIQICLLIFIYRLIKRFYYFLKPKRITIGPCGSIPEDLLKYIKNKKAGEKTKKWK